jgi:hypothetical protein
MRSARAPNALDARIKPLDVLAHGTTIALPQARFQRTAALGGCPQPIRALRPFARQGRAHGPQRVYGDFSAPSQCFADEPEDRAGAVTHVGVIFAGRLGPRDELVEVACWRQAQSERVD